MASNPLFKMFAIFAAPALIAFGVLGCTTIADQPNVRSAITAIVASAAQDSD